MKFFFSSHLHKVPKHTQCVYLTTRLIKLFELLGFYVGDTVLRTAVLSAYYSIVHPETFIDIDNVRQSDFHPKS